MTARSPMAVAIFCVIVLITVLITLWAGRRKVDADGLYVAHGELKGWQNGLAIAGDLVSASALLGTVGYISLKGVSGLFLISGPFVALLFLTFVLAEPLRNLGRFTVADAVACRFRGRAVRVAMAFNSLLVTLFYMLGQLVAAGTTLSLLLGLDYAITVMVVGLLMTIYIVVGGMLATSWIQIVKAVLLMGCMAIMAVMLFARFDFDFTALVKAARGNGADLFRFEPTTMSGLNTVSMALATVGTAGLPHVLIRFLTVPDAREARKSLTVGIWVLVPAFLCVALLGLGAAAIVGSTDILALNAAGNLATLQLAHELGGEFLFAVVAGVAFATILAIVSGLLIAGSGVLAHDLYNSVLRKGAASEREQVAAGRIAAVVLSLVSILAAILAQHVNVAVLGVLAVVVAASANVPVLILVLFWRRFNAAGVVAGAAAGLVSSAALIFVGPAVMGENALFPLDYPTLVSVPLGILGCWLGTAMSRSADKGTDFDEMTIAVAFGDRTEVESTMTGKGAAVAA